MLTYLYLTISVRSSMSVASWFLSISAKLPADRQKTIVTVIHQRPAICTQRFITDIVSKRSFPLRPFLISAFLHSFAHDLHGQVFTSGAGCETL